MDHNEILKKYENLKYFIQEIFYITDGLQPNSGHMYLSDINEIHELCCAALELEMDVEDLKHNES